MHVCDTSKVSNRFVDDHAKTAVIKIVADAFKRQVQTQSIHADASPNAGQLSSAALLMQKYAAAREKVTAKLIYFIQAQNEQMHDIVRLEARRLGGLHGLGPENTQVALSEALEKFGFDSSEYFMNTGLLPHLQQSLDVKEFKDRAQKSTIECLNPKAMQALWEAVERLKSNGLDIQSIDPRHVHDFYWEVFYEMEPGLPQTAFKQMLIRKGSVVALDREAASNAASAGADARARQWGGAFSGSGANNFAISNIPFLAPPIPSRPVVFLDACPKAQEPSVTSLLSSKTANPLFMDQMMNEDEAVASSHPGERPPGRQISLTPAHSLEDVQMQGREFSTTAQQSAQVKRSIEIIDVDDSAKRLRPDSVFGLSPSPPTLPIDGPMVWGGTESSTQPFQAASWGSLQPMNTTDFDGSLNAMDQRSPPSPPWVVDAESVDTTNLASPTSPQAPTSHAATP